MFFCNKLKRRYLVFYTSCIASNRVITNFPYVKKLVHYVSDNYSMSLYHTNIKTQMKRVFIENYDSK